MPLLASLKHRPFLLLWLGQTISGLGDQVYAIALAWWVLEKTHSAAAMGFTLVASFLPTVVFLLVGGVVADRLPRLAIMLVSDLARGALVGVVAILAFMGTLPFWPIIAVSFGFGVMDAFFGPAYSAVVPELLPAPELASANALKEISARAMAIVGPTLGALLIVIGGTPLAFVLNSASFFLSALSLCGATPLLRGRAQASDANPDDAASPRLGALLAAFGRDLREGWATVWGLTWVWLTIAIAGVANLVATGAVDVALPFYVQRTLHSPLLYGGLTAVSAVGSLLGAVWFGSRKLRRRGWVIYGFFIVAMLALVVIGIAPTPAIILGGMLIFGLSVTSLGLAWVTALQQYIPNEQMGRVTSIDELGSYVGIPLSYGLAGILADRLAPTVMLTWGGALAAGVIALGLFSRSVRRLD